MPSVPGMMSISDKEFDLMRKLIYERFGISLSREKRSLLVGRLQKILRKSGLTTFKEYYEGLLSEKHGQGISELVDNISTNHTYFNREKAHFDYFSTSAFPETLTKLTKKNSKDIRVWCAGCSSGEEPYTLLMLMHEVLGNQYGSFDGGILATDISNRILTTAKAGIYAKDRVSDLPDSLQRKYFTINDKFSMQVKESIRREVVFRRFNLMNQTFPFKKKFQIIFCRNVMIYFDQDTRDLLVSRFHNCLEPGGYFFIGHSETLGRDQELFNYIMPAAYQKK